MNNFTSNTYEMKREIMNFCKIPQLKDSLNTATQRFFKLI